MGACSSRRSFAGCWRQRPDDIRQISDALASASGPNRLADIRPKSNFSNTTAKHPRSPAGGESTAVEDSQESPLNRKINTKGEGNSQTATDSDTAAISVVSNGLQSTATTLHEPLRFDTSQTAVSKESNLRKTQSEASGRKSVNPAKKLLGSATVDVMESVDRLEQKERRRLSVSTVDQDANELLRSRGIPAVFDEVSRAAPVLGEAQEERESARRGSESSGFFVGTESSEDPGSEAFHSSEEEQSPQHTVDNDPDVASKSLKPKQIDIAATSAANSKPEFRMNSDGTNKTSKSAVRSTKSGTETISTAADSVEAQKAKGPKSSPRNLPPGVSQNTKRYPVKKVRDAALKLVDAEGGRVQKVTPSMILDLFAEESAVFAMFGSPAPATQQGFEKKELHCAGSLTSSMGPAELERRFRIGYACKKGLKPESPNQDDFFLMRSDDWQMFGVFDGHGPHGHDVSGFVHRSLPYLLLADASFDRDPEMCLKRCFRRVHHLLEATCDARNASFDCTLSGTTGTVILQRDGYLWAASVGDSRAVLAVKNSSSSTRTSSFKAYDLTRDHKPLIPEEKARIESHGGEVRRLQGDIPHRVFMKNRMFPGLAMSRAIGDSIGTSIGVVPDPDVTVHAIRKQKDAFVILASDGVWEFIDSQEAVDIVAKRGPYEAQKAADDLAMEAWKRWVDEEGNVVDDITCIVFYLQS